MGAVGLLVLAIGLSFDTFAVSISTGCISKYIKFWQATKIAIIFSLIQGLTPVLGWLIGLSIENLVGEYDHWIAFGLLSLIGAKMIHESTAKVGLQHENRRLSFIMLLGMALATSIDAFIAGISLAFIEVNILISFIIIFSITYIAAMLGLLCGKKTGQRFGKKMEVVGGIILIILGLKVLWEHDIIRF